MVLSECSGGCCQSSKPGSTAPGYMDKNKLTIHMVFSYKIKTVIIETFSQDMRGIRKLAQIKSYHELLPGSDSSLNKIA